MSEPFVGQIQAFGFNFAPRGWAQCNGQLLSISENSALYSLLGTTYGGDGKTTFGLPDLRGRAALHMGQGPGLGNYPIGQKAGMEGVTLTVNQIPSHSHEAAGLTAVMRCNDTSADHASPVGNTIARVGDRPVFDTDPPDADMHADSVLISGNVATAGGSQPHNNMQPYLVVNFCIALIGVYPSRS